MMACDCRVSTHRQKVDSQKADILRWLTGHAVAPAAIPWFEDIESGTTLKRPAFDRMQPGIFAGTIRTVVVWKLDRIARRQREGVHLLAEWCERRGRVVGITPQRDLSGAVGRLVARVLFGLAEIEHAYRRERQAAGIAVAKRQGRYHGRAKGTTKAQPARARLLHERGCTVAELGQALQLSPRTAYRYLATAEKT